MPTLNDLQSVNTTVNRIPYNALLQPGEADDIVKDRPDGGNWVCRDYAVRKGQELQSLGFPESALTLIICWTEPFGDPFERQRHEVLGVHLDDELYILDSRYDQVGLWDSDPWTAYQWEHELIIGTQDWRDASTGLV